MIDLYIEHYSDIAILHIEGKFNIENLSKVETVWMDLVRRDPRMIAINCLGLKSMDSTAIGSVVKFFNHAMRHGIRLVFYDLSQILLKLFVTAKLDRYFTIMSRAEFESRFKVPARSPSCDLSAAKPATI